MSSSATRRTQGFEDRVGPSLVNENPQGALCFGPRAAPKPCLEEVCDSDLSWDGQEAQPHPMEVSHTCSHLPRGGVWTRASTTLKGITRMSPLHREAPRRV
jgi:hypothetical protein